MLKNALGAEFIEIVYEEAWDDFGSGHVFRWFTEGSVVGGGVFRKEGAWQSWPCNFPGTGNFIGFRATEIIGTNKWNFKIDCLDGTGDHTVAANRLTTFSFGLQLRETFRLGGAATGMSDDQKILQYRPGDYTSWTAWTGGLCWSDIPGNNWNGHMYSVDHYQTLKNSTNSCPQP